jgi:hypothetical protein
MWFSLGSEVCIVEWLEGVVFLYVIVGTFTGLVCCALSYFILRGGLHYILHYKVEEELMDDGHRSYGQCSCGSHFSMFLCFVVGSEVCVLLSCWKPLTYGRTKKSFLALKL